MITPPTRQEFIDAFKNKPSLRVLIYLVEDIADAINNATINVDITLDEFSKSQFAVAATHELNKDIDDVKNQLSSTHNQLSGLLGRMQGLLEHLKCVDNRVVASELELRLLFGLIQGLDTKTTDFTVELEDINNTLATVIQTDYVTRSEIDDLGNQIAGINQGDYATKSELGQLHEEIAANTSDYSIPKEKLAELENTLVEISVCCSTNSGRIQGIIQDVISLFSLISDIEQVNVAVGARISALEATVYRLNNQVQDTNNWLSQAYTTIKIQAGLIKNLKQQVDDGDNLGVCG